MRIIWLPKLGKSTWVDQKHLEIYYKDNGKYKFRPLIIEKVYPEEKLVRVGLSSTQLQSKYIFEINIPEKKLHFTFDKYEIMIISEINLKKKLLDLREYLKIYKMFEQLKQSHEHAWKQEKTKLAFEQTIIIGQYALLSPKAQEYERTINQFSLKEQAHRIKCKKERMKLIEQMNQNKIVNIEKKSLYKTKGEQEFNSTKFLNEADKILKPNKQESETQK
ncbi:hypothetical protein [Williamsoniiplasma lucivorax]|uniref:Uncharacterized protein n=2 Tax=Williamsoniiplasma lucivorax TaxID=209274 RepID=A0A2S5RDS4_9MOLU|nr:hypothetical protein [Williamsoniiplasma lucivorax]PPE05489.1 hypothetical protein ELUCI_v1c05820 [Williamsoniiplasma lucivorax]